MLKIHESGMRFELPKSKTFPIEKSKTYQKVNTRGVSAVEFITMSPKLDIVQSWISFLSKQRQVRQTNKMEKK